MALFLDYLLGEVKQKRGLNLGTNLFLEIISKANPLRVLIVVLCLKY
jgi:hypothetical protein